MSSLPGMEASSVPAMSPQAACENADWLWSSLLREYSFLKDRREVQEIRKQLKRREVTISVFGRHNCGKSTLLNILLGNNCLPVEIDNETGVQVKIKHDKTVHAGYCSDHCGGGCPRLVEEFADGNERVVAIGADDIEEELHKVNSLRRQTGLQNGTEMDGHNQYILYAHVPILEGAPAGLSLALVDTPGFGEANVDHVALLTDTLFNTSSAYLYIMDGRQMGDSTDAENIKRLYRKDRELFADGRIVIVVSKYDIHFTEQHAHQRKRRDKVVNANTMKQKVRQLITESVGVEPPPDVTTPVSADWAGIAQRLRQNPDDESKRRSAVAILDSYPDHQPQGQGETTHSSLNLAVGLERASGIVQLEERLRSTIQRCIYIWESSLVKAYTGYLTEAHESLMQFQDQRTRERERIQYSMDLHSKYEAEKKKLTDLAFVEENEKTDVQEKLEKKYVEQDVPAAKRLLHGRIDLMMKAFANEMKVKVMDKEHPLLQHRLEQEVKRFIREEAEPTLGAEQENIKLEGVASEFRSCQRDMEKLDQEIEVIAMAILPENWSPDSDVLRKERAQPTSDVLSDEVLQRKQLTLKDLQERAKAPPLSIGLFERFWNRVKVFFGKKVDPDDEKPHRKWSKELDDMVTDLKTDLTHEVDKYLTGTLQSWILLDVLSTSYQNQVKKRAEALMQTYEGAVRRAKLELDEAGRRCTTEEDMATLAKRIGEIQTAQENLKR